MSNFIKEARRVALYRNENESKFDCPAQLKNYVLDKADKIYTCNDYLCADYGLESQKILFSIIENGIEEYYILDLEQDYYSYFANDTERLKLLSEKEFLNILKEEYMQLRYDNNELIQKNNKLIKEKEKIKNEYDKESNSFYRSFYKINSEEAHILEQIYVLHEMINYYSSLKRFRLNRNANNVSSYAFKYRPKAIYWDGSGTSKWKLSINKCTIDDEKAKYIYLEELEETLQAYKEKVNIKIFK